MEIRKIREYLERHTKELEFLRSHRLTIISIFRIAVLEKEIERLNKLLRGE